MSRITRLALYRVDLASWGGESRYNRQQRLEAPLDVNVLRLDTDAGLTGWGESCTPQPFYMPTLSSAARAAIRYAAPLVVGAAADSPNAIMDAVATAMRGQKPSKSALEMALWDLYGKLCGLPLYALFGGRVAAQLPVMAMVSAGTPDSILAGIEEYRERGYRLFQIKIGLGGYRQDIETIDRACAALADGERCWFDVNRGWSLDDAMQVLPAVTGHAPLLEQPCETYRECLHLSRRFGLGLMLDELIDSPDALIRARADGIVDVAVLKLASTGGLTRQRALAELATHYRIPARIEDYYGSGITMAALAHIAHALPASSTFALYDYHLPEVPIVSNPLAVSAGLTSLPPDCAPGLGVEVDEAVLGEPLFVIE